MRRLMAGVGAACAARYLFDRRELAGWKRLNYRGQEVDLSGGLDALAGLLASSLAGGKRIDLAAALAAGSGAIAGFVDDHLEKIFPEQAKGFRGHITALRDGKLTSGIAKIALVGIGSGSAALLLTKVRGVDSQGAYRVFPSVIVDAGIIAFSANLLNLLDLRPGRARKAAILGAAALVNKRALAVGGAVVPGINSDLHGKTMLGDLGANALGAQLGFEAVAHNGMPMRVVLLGVLAAANLASEKISFSEAISRNRLLSALDSLGR